MAGIGHNDTISGSVLPLLRFISGILPVRAHCSGGVQKGVNEHPNGNFDAELADVEDSISTMVDNLKGKMQDAEKMIKKVHKKGAANPIYGIFNRHFYVYQPPRDLAEIDADLAKVSAEIMQLLREVHS